MSWARLDDACTDHLKLRRAGTAGLALWTASIVWCSRHLTDGFIPTDMLHDIWRPVGESFDADSACARLVATGLWDEVEGGWRVHDYLDYNPSREEVMRSREQAAERQRRRRSKHVTPDVTRDVHRDSRGTYTVSHATPSRPVPSRTPSGVGARARVAPSGPIETGARLRARLEDVIREATGTGPILDHRRAHADAIVAKVDAATLGEEVEAYGAWLAACAPEKRPGDPWLRFVDHVGTWRTRTPKPAEPKVVIRVNPLAAMGGSDGE